jgi:hypothetical protein
MDNDARKPIDVVKTQLHYIVADMDKISKYITEIREDIIYIKDHLKNQKIKEEKDKQKELIEKKKLQEGWGLF